MKSPAGADRGEVERMNEEKDKTVVLLQGSMLALNVAAVLLISTFIYYTTERIIYRYDARSFLDGVTAIPENPGKGDAYLCHCGNPAGGIFPVPADH